MLEMLQLKEILKLHDWWLMACLLALRWPLKSLFGLIVSGLLTVTLALGLVHQFIRLQCSIGCSTVDL